MRRPWDDRCGIPDLYGKSTTPLLILSIPPHSPPRGPVLQDTSPPRHPAFAANASTDFWGKAAGLRTPCKQRLLGSDKGFRREGEDAPCTGQKPRGWISAPRSRRPDKAPESGDPARSFPPSKRRYTKESTGITLLPGKPRGHAKDSAAACRACVQACVPYLRSVERSATMPLPRLPAVEAKGTFRASGPSGTPRALSR